MAGQPATFSLQARDTYGNLTSNGGERFEVKVSVPDSLNAKQLAELKNGRLAMLAFGGMVTQAQLTGHEFPFLY